MTEEPDGMLDVVNQAQGMISVQADCTLAAALQMMTDRAIVSRCTVTDIAVATVDGSIRFGSRPT